MFQIDNSPPTVGAFAISTSHVMDSTLQESRNADDFMTYTQVVHQETEIIFNEITNQTEEVVTVEYAPAQLHLAWIGFADPHSDIDFYTITIGHTYRGNDMIEVMFR